MSAPDPAARLTELMQSHAAITVSRYAGRIAQWDVVNELALEITELDIPLPIFASAAEPLAAQAAAYEDVFAACLAHPECTGVTTWGIDDSDTWLDEFEITAANAPNRPLLFDAEGPPKPAYDAVIQRLPEPSSAALSAVALLALAAVSARSRTQHRARHLDGQRDPSCWDSFFESRRLESRQRSTINLLRNSRTHLLRIQRGHHLAFIGILLAPGVKIPSSAVHAAESRADLWMFFSAITISGFAATIVSPLTAENPSTTVRGVQDLASVRSIAVAESTGEDILRRKGVSTLVVATPAEGLAMWKSGRAEALVHDEPLLDLLEDAEPGVVVLPRTIERQAYGFGLPGGPARHEALDEALSIETSGARWDEILNRHLASR